MLKLFVSYCHEKENKELIERIVKQLRVYHYDVWFDDDRIRVGDTIITQIQKGISECDFFICFITNEYIQSRNCLLEFHYAANLNKKCIYILLEPIDRNTTSSVNMFLFGDAARLDAFKYKDNGKLWDGKVSYEDAILSEIIRAIS